VWDIECLIVFTVDPTKMDAYPFEIGMWVVMGLNMAWNENMLKRKSQMATGTGSHFRKK
jgi:hypothetical protein